MSFVKILHCADLHIGATCAFLEEKAEKRRIEALLCFERIIEKANNSAIDIVLIAGDLFNSNQIEDLFVERVLSAVSECRAQVVYCAGNHDPLNLESPFKNKEIPANLHILPAHDSVITFDRLKARVYGRSFSEAYMSGTAKFGLTPPYDDYVNIMCIHGELKSDLDSNYNPITKSFIETSGMDYIALGHIHKRTEIAKIANTYCAYSGCTEAQGFDELGEKGIYCGIVSKKSCNLEFVPIAQRIHICETVDITNADNSADAANIILSNLKSNYGESYEKNLYKISVSGSLKEGKNISFPEIETRLNQKLYYIKLIDSSTVEIDYESISKEKNIKGIFVKKMLEKIESAEDSQKDNLKCALKIGLEAFYSEVYYDENQ